MAQNQMYLLTDNLGVLRGELEARDDETVEQLKMRLQRGLRPVDALAATAH